MSFSNSSKYYGIEVINDLSSSGSFIIKDGYLFFGDTYTSTNESNNILGKFYMGTSETKGNISRDNYNINTNGSIKFNETADDKKLLIKDYPSIVANNPIITKYPWLYPLSIYQQRSQNTQSILNFSKEFPIYKCLGKGIGEVNFYKVGSPNIGQEDKAGFTVSYEVNGMTYGTLPSEYTDGPIYPFDGHIYSGTLVQLIVETNEDNVKETKVIPYQQGRGIPLYCDNFLPSDVDKLTEFSPFGELKWPDSDNTISPSLATGVNPANENACVGIVLDTFSSDPIDQRLFKYKYPNGFTKEQLDNDKHDKWYNHPAPHTVPPVSVKNKLISPNVQGFLNPGPNSANSYFSPWPRYYAYNSNDPIPVLTRGITTARIGASYNIALTSYGIKEQISPTDESWIPISCIPLFQGEKIEAGSYIYASVKGQLFTPGPEIKVSPPIENNTQYENINTCIPFGRVGQTPWDICIDTTWGNIGWSGTPGLSFSNIPDHEINILEVLKDTEGNTKYIPYLNQSNQGSIIVHAVSTTFPTPGTGSSYLTTFREDSQYNYTEEQKNSIYKNRAKLPGISGRATLPQTVPEKAQPIGILMETIEGTGKWTYTGLPVENTVNSYSENCNIIQGGAVYPNPIQISGVLLSGGSGSGATATWSEFTSSSPNLGTITGIPTVVDAGINYTDGEVVTLFNNDLAVQQPVYKGNNATVAYDFSGGTLQLTSGGSGYTTSTIVEGYNLTDNNVYLNFTLVSNSLTNNLSGIPSLEYYQDFSRVNGLNRKVRIIGDGIPFQFCAVFRLDDISFGSQVKTSIAPGDGYTSSGFYEYEDIDFELPPPEFSITAESGVVTSVDIVSYGGKQHKTGDIILLLEGNSNATIEFPEINPIEQRICYSSVPNIFSRDKSSSIIQYNAIDATNGGIPTNLIFSIPDTKEISYAPSSQIPDFSNYFENKLSLPQFWQYIGGDLAPETVYQITYTGSYNNVIPRPWYFCRRSTIYFDDSGNLTNVAGGTNYTSAKNVSCYNLSANSLRVLYNVSNKILTSHVSGTIAPYDDINLQFLNGRYTYGNNGTQVRLLYDDIDENEQLIIKLKDLDADPLGTGLEVEEIRPSGIYTDIADGQWLFQTQRLDQINPTVDITVGGTLNNVKRIKINNFGKGNQEGDLILITQPESHYNAIFRYTVKEDEIPVIDLPPFATPPDGFRVLNDDKAWKRYSDVMSSAVNLLDKEVLVELRPTNEMTMENVLPTMTLGESSEVCPTRNVYKDFY